MNLALNNLKRVDMPLKKETKPNLFNKPSQLELYNTPIAFLKKGKTYARDNCLVYELKQSDGVALTLEL